MRYALNHKVANNYAFYDPESRLHLTMSLPVATTTRETSGIRKGIASKVIIALDEPEVPVSVKENKQEEVKVNGEENSKETVSKETLQEVIPNVEETKETEAAAPVATETTKKKGGRKAATATEE